MYLIVVLNVAKVLTCLQMNGVYEFFVSIIVSLKMALGPNIK